VDFAAGVEGLASLFDAVDFESPEPFSDFAGVSVFEVSVFEASPFFGRFPPPLRLSFL
jgi:hypothetical protein